MCVSIGDGITFGGKYRWDDLVIHGRRVVVGLTWVHVPSAHVIYISYVQGIALDDFLMFLKLSYNAE